MNGPLWRICVYQKFSKADNFVKASFWQSFPSLIDKCLIMS